MKLLKYTRRIHNSIKTRGLYNTINLITDDYFFKQKFGVDTGGVYELKELKTLGNNADRGVYYQGTNYRYFKKTMQKVIVNFSESTFIDFGCGKGKALIMAGEYGFKKIIGVEFAKELYDICLQNIEKIKPKVAPKNFEILHEDATEFEIPNDVNVFFFNNPFDYDLTEEVVKKMDLSLQANPRKIYVIYFSPLHKAVFEKRNYEQVFELKAKNKLEAIVLSK
ncbi:class I SAM-dependent methyltransferase [Bacteroidales bacterium AH-315-I05]|nr:class I SAM-dependent methyltransferase [Bacteroidales bacterium AH-315-I05]